MKILTFYVSNQISIKYNISKNAVNQIYQLQTWWCCIKFFKRKYTMVGVYYIFLLNLPSSSSTEKNAIKKFLERLWDQKKWTVQKLSRVFFSFSSFPPIFVSNEQKKEIVLARIYILRDRLIAAVIVEYVMHRTNLLLFFFIKNGWNRGPVFSSV